MNSFISNIYLIIHHNGVYGKNVLAIINVATGLFVLLLHVALSKQASHLVQGGSLLFITV
jgi:hypothetical protein